MSDTPRLHHGATLSTADLRRAGVTGPLPKPEQYHPEHVVESNGKFYVISAPTTRPGCGRTLFFNVWEKKMEDLSVAATIIRNMVRLHESLVLRSRKDVVDEVAKRLDREQL